MASITCGYCKETHASVAEVRTCAGTTAGRPAEEQTEFAPAATDRQRSYVADLRRTRGLPARDTDTMTKREAHDEIDRLQKLPKVGLHAVAYARPGTAGNEEPADGIYIVDGETPVIYKVYKMVHGSGRQGVKRLDTALAGEAIVGKFIYLGLATRCLPTAARRMTLEEAKRFGKLYGFCIRCGATLTDEVSIAEGIGPVCGKREGWAS